MRKAPSNSRAKSRRQSTAPCAGRQHNLSLRSSEVDRPPRSRDGCIGSQLRFDPVSWSLANALGTLIRGLAPQRKGAVAPHHLLGRLFGAARWRIKAIRLTFSKGAVPKPIGVTLIRASSLDRVDSPGI